MDKSRNRGISSATLHILAMIFMLCDHLWARLVPGNEWLTCIGRLTFPIYAFMIVEGYFHTRSVKNYAKRLFILALLSEIPFNLMYSSSAIYPFHQNVIWTLLMGLGAIHLIEKTKIKGKLWLTVLVTAGVTLLGLVLGYLLMTDYFGPGVVMVVVFYLFRHKNWWSKAGLFCALWYINTEMLGGLYYPVEIFGHSFQLVQQSLAVLSLVFIWLYNGKKGYSKPWFQKFCYAFYPVHMLIIAVIAGI